MMTQQHKIAPQASGYKHGESPQFVQDNTQHANFEAKTDVGTGPSRVDAIGKFGESRDSDWTQNNSMLISSRFY